jgi:hypothetical protein
VIADLYACFFREISRYLLSLIRNKAEAEDLTQDTFMRAMAHGNKFLDMSSAQYQDWLYRGTWQSPVNKKTHSGSWKVCMLRAASLLRISLKHPNPKKRRTLIMRRSTPPIINSDLPLPPEGDWYRLSRRHRQKAFESQVRLADASRST